jgi:hypothetical protein
MLPRVRVFRPVVHILLYLTRFAGNNSSKTLRMNRGKLLTFRLKGR